MGDFIGVIVVGFLFVLYIFGMNEVVSDEHRYLGIDAVTGYLSVPTIGR